MLLSAKEKTLAHLCRPCRRHGQIKYTANKQAFSHKKTAAVWPQFEGYQLFFSFPVSYWKAPCSPLRGQKYLPQQLPWGRCCHLCGWLSTLSACHSCGGYDVPPDIPMPFPTWLCRERRISLLLQKASPLPCRLSCPLRNSLSGLFPCRWTSSWGICPCRHRWWYLRQTSFPK